MSVWIFLSKTDMFLSLGAKDGPAVPLGHAHHHAGRTLDQVLGPVFPGQHHGAAQLGADAGHSGIWAELDRGIDHWFDIFSVLVLAFMCSYILFAFDVYISFGILSSHFSKGSTQRIFTNRPTFFFLKLPRIRSKNYSPVLTKGKSCEASLIAAFLYVNSVVHKT